ncbi:hypothetical protein CEXT_536381, partial [Caerostris extrusa]
MGAAAALCGLKASVLRGEWGEGDGCQWP